jgi:hypothetical protein
LGATPTSVSLTTNSGDEADLMARPLQQLIGLIDAGRLEVPVGRVFRMDQIMEAHPLIEGNGAAWKAGVLP